MFDRFRRKEAVVSGVGSEVKDSMKKGKRKLNFREKIDISKLDDDDKIKALIEGLMESNALESTTVAFERYALFDEKYRVFVERFKKLIVEVQKEKKAEALAVQIEKIIEELKALVGPARELVSIDKFKNVITKEASDIDIFTNDAIKGLNDFVRKQTDLTLRIKEYNDNYGPYTYDHVAICTKEEIRSRYELIAIEVDRLQKELVTAPDNKKNFIKAKLDSLNGLIELLPNLMENPLSFEPIKAEVDKQISSNRKAKEDDKVKLSNDVRELLISSQSKLMSKLKLLDFTINDDLREVNEKLRNIVASYPSLSEDEKYTIAQDIVKKEGGYFPNVSNDLVKALVGDRGVIAAIHYAIDPLYNIDFSNDEFKRSLFNVEAVVADMARNPVLIAHGATVNFDDKYNFSIKIPELGINYSKPVFDVNKYQDYMANEINDVLADYARDIKIIYSDNMTVGLELISKMEKFDLSQIDELIKAKGQEYKVKLEELGIDSDKAVDFINRKTLEVSSELERKYNKKDLAVVKFVQNDLAPKFTYIRNGITELKKLEFGTPEADAKYNEVRQLISNLLTYVNGDECKEYGVKMIYDELSEKIAFDYNCPLLQPFAMEVLTNEALKAKNARKSEEPPAPPKKEEPPVNPVPGNNGSEQPNPTTSEPTPVGSEEERIRDEQSYIELMNIINLKIQNLNDINSRSYPFADQVRLTEDFIRNSIQLEKLAKDLDFEILSLKTELSTKRAEYTNKYKKLLFSNQTIKNMKFEKIKFPVNYQLFVEKHDSLIVEAEAKISELLEKRDSSVKTEEITAQIGLLLEFIDCQNSVVGRFLINECEKADINIVEMLEKRREFKKNLRAQLQKSKSQEPVPEETESKSSDKEKTTEQSEGEVVVTNKQMSFNPKKLSKVNRKHSEILTDVDTLTLSVIKNGIKIKYSRDLAKKLQEVKARLALVNKKNYRVRKTAQLGIADDDTLVESELAFKTKEEIDPDDYKIEIRNDDGVLYEYDLANLPDSGKGRAR